MLESLFLDGPFEKLGCTARVRMGAFRGSGRPRGPGHAPTLSSLSLGTWGLFCRQWEALGVE